MSEHSLDQLDVDLLDGELLEEVELTAALMVAANQSETLSLAEIDELLGVSAAPAGTCALDGASGRIA